MSLQGHIPPLRFHSGQSTGVSSLKLQQHPRTEGLACVRAWGRAQPNFSDPPESKCDWQGCWQGAPRADDLGDSRPLPPYRPYSAWPQSRRFVWGLVVLLSGASLLQKTEVGGQERNSLLLFSLVTFTLEST